MNKRGGNENITAYSHNSYTGWLVLQNQNMPDFITGYIALYGYAAIFCWVLLQEMGMPGIPNELVLIYCGYLAHGAGLSYLIILAVVVLADIVASLFLYILFYHGRWWLLRIKPKWISLPEKKIMRVKAMMVTRNGRKLFICKLTPFVRSYVPVVAGLLQLPTGSYTRIVLLTAVIWSGGLVTIGWVIKLFSYAGISFFW